MLAYITLYGEGGVKNWHFLLCNMWTAPKGREICIAPHRKKLNSEALMYMDHTVFTLQTHHTCLYLVSVHQTAPLLIVIAAI